MVRVTSDYGILQISMESGGDPSERSGPGPSPPYERTFLHLFIAFMETMSLLSSKSYDMLET